MEGTKGIHLTIHIAAISAASRRFPRGDVTSGGCDTRRVSGGCR